MGRGCIYIQIDAGRIRCGEEANILQAQPRVEFTSCGSGLSRSHTLLIFWFRFMVEMMGSQEYLYAVKIGSAWTTGYYWHGAQAEGHVFLLNSNRIG